MLAHEFGHALGLLHEQQREDRDDFLTINWASIDPGQESQFEKGVAPDYVDLAVA